MQTIIALTIVALVVVYAAWRTYKALTIKRRNNHCDGCSHCCNCHALLPLTLLALPTIAAAQDPSATQNTSVSTAQSTSLFSTQGMQYTLEAQTSLADGTTPLWLNANRYGLSSLDASNGYLRIAIEKATQAPKRRSWGVGYGIDLAAAYNNTSAFIVQPLYGELQWRRGALTVGSKQQPLELKNQRLSTGGQTLGVNARPVPQVRLALPAYWQIPHLSYVGFKGHIAYGRTTDGHWQKDFTNGNNKYTNNTLYHSKAAYLRFASPKLEQKGRGLELQLGLETAVTFGGTSYIAQEDDGLLKVNNDASLRAYLNALTFTGADAVEDQYRNAAGNQVGSWLARLTWHSPSYDISLYADKFFEDHSAAVLIDYNGYGDNNGYVLYDPKDMMLGAELNLKGKGFWGSWLKDIVAEYIYTKYQSGPIYHDHTTSISDHIGGQDDYYNHYVFAGWQHWGQVIGNPLYRSPLYNSDGTVRVANNRFVAYHVALGGQPPIVAGQLSYRLLATYQEGLGTYLDPYNGYRSNFSLMIEAQYSPACQRLKGWSVTAACALDSGQLYGNNKGLQLTITKRGFLR